MGASERDEILARLDRVLRRLEPLLDAAERHPLVRALLQKVKTHAER